MTRQTVKSYVNKVGDHRFQTKNITITEQINLDLKDNPHWFIHILQYTDNGELCTVVYNIDKEVEEHVYKDVAPDVFSLGKYGGGLVDNSGSSVDTKEGKK
jgi:hypothetical protein